MGTGPDVICVAFVWSGCGKCVQEKSVAEAWSSLLLISLLCFALGGARSLFIYGVSVAHPLWVWSLGVTFCLSLGCLPLARLLGGFSLVRPSAASPWRFAFCLCLDELSLACAMAVCPLRVPGEFLPCLLPSFWSFARPAMVSPSLDHGQSSSF